jgi:hypothetical protein
MAFGIGKELDPTYGSVQAKLINFYYTGNTLPNGSQERIKLKTTIPIELCTANTFNYSDFDYATARNINNLYCMKSKDYLLAGDYYAYNFSYVEVKLYLC